VKGNQLEVGKDCIWCDIMMKKLIAEERIKWADNKQIRKSETCWQQQMTTRRRGLVTC